MENQNISTQFREYDLSPAFDISSASLVNSISAGGQARQIEISDDGLKILAIADSRFKEYTLGVAFDLSSAVNTDNLIPAPAPASGGIIADGGTRIFYDTPSGTVRSYTLPTAFDLTGATADADAFATGFSFINNLLFNDDGTVLIAVGTDGGSDAALEEFTSSIPSTTSFVIGTSTETALANAKFTGLVSSCGAIDYPSAAVGDELYDTGSGLALNGSGTLIGICAQADVIVLIDENLSNPTTNAGFLESITNGITESSSLTTDTVGTASGAGILNELQIQYEGSGTVLIDQVLISTGSLVDEPIDIDQQLRNGAQIGIATITVPLKYKYTDDVTVKIVHDSTTTGGTVDCTLYYKEE